MAHSIVLSAVVFIGLLYAERAWTEFMFEVKYQAWLDSLPVAETVDVE